ncbi:MAG TPA: outer membrane lipoprotein carrier protein LolA [Myxococcales bacterium]|nr:outer membrane lipoprotein carrier protein LolA [Myxococcales bacterium]
MKQTQSGPTIAQKAKGQTFRRVRAAIVLVTSLVSTAIPATIGSTIVAALIAGTGAFTVLCVSGTQNIARADATAEPLEVLAARFAAMPGLSAHFREEKHLALLMAPLKSEGTLYFSPPGLLVRHVESPISSSVLIREGRLSIVSGRSKMNIDLETNPAVRVFVDSLRLVLAGDLPALRILYRVEMLAFDPADQGAWALSLKPLDPALEKVLKVIELRGSGNRLGELRVQEVNGDLSITQFSDVNSQRLFRAEELDSLFALPTS